MRRRGDVARALLAGAMLGAVVVGVPLLLARLVGWPLPHHVPQVSEIADALGRRRVPEPTTVWKILSVVVWLAWAQVLVSVVTELAAVVRGGIARPLPGLRLAHGLVAPLVTAVALAWPGGPARPAAATTSTVQEVSAPPPTALAPHPRPTPGVVPPPAPGNVATARTTINHVVVRRDTLWDLAEHYLGHGYRADELFEANQGRPQPDGDTLADPGLLRPGWVLSIPVDGPAVPLAADEIVVRHGDTLWGLAEAHLGDGHRFGEVFDLNAGRAQPGGGALVDRDVIEPGWVLRMPPGLSAPEIKPSPLPAPAGAERDPVPTAVEPAPTSVTTQPALLPTPATATPSVPPSTVAAKPPAPAAVEVRRAPAVKTPAATSDAAPAPAVPVGLIGGGVATAGLVLLLDRRRRAQQRRRRAGRVLPQPEPETVVAERALRAGADVESATLIDVAMRAAAAGAGPGGLPPIRWVEVGDGAVVLVLDDDTPAPGGFRGDGPGRWRSAANLSELANLGAPALSPTPGLIPVGRDAAGTEFLVDIEEAGVVSVVGDAAATSALLRALAVSLASAPWSDTARVVLVGFDPHEPALSELAEVTTSDVALVEARHTMDAATAGLERRGCPTVARARATGAAIESWSAPVAVVAGTVDQSLLDLVQEVERRPGHGVCVVMAVGEDATPTGRVLTVDADGSLHVDGPDHPLQAWRLEDSDAGAIADLLDTASAGDVPPSEVALPAPPRAPTPATGGKDALAELLDEVDVLVRVLGPIEVVRRSPDGEDRLEVGIQKSVETIVYLALRETPADREELQAALWPAGTNSAKTFQNVVWAARKALGAARDGTDLLPDPVDCRYGLNPRLVSTYGLFHELAARADESDDAQAAADLLAQALTLVHGEPFVGLGRNFAWVAPHAGMIVSQIVDAAEELAEIRLAAGDWRGAEWAARQGLASCPSDERLYRLLMRCADAAGSIAGVQRVFQELLAAVADPDCGVEPIDTVHAETVALLEALTSDSKPRRGVHRASV